MPKKALFLFLILLFFFLIDFYFLEYSFKQYEKEISQILLAQEETKLQNPPLTINLIFVGDIMLDRGVKLAVKKHGENDFRFPFVKIASELQDADLLFGNLESVISDKGKKVGSIYSFRAPPPALEGLTFAGFDILSVANNHIFDYGKEAMEDSFLRLKEAKIDYVGGGFNEKEACEPKIKKIKRTKIALLAFTNLGAESWRAGEEKSGICWLEEEKLKETIKKAKEVADLIIVSFHFGDEYQEKANPSQKFWAHLAIDSGADLVIGNHPHVVQEVEEYNGGYIAYSLGNFIFDQSFSKETSEGLMLKVIIEKKKIKEIEPIKIKINEFFQAEIPEK